MTNQAFEQKRAEQAREQERINRIHAEHGSVATIDAIRQRAAIDHASYSQYDGFWSGDEWTLAKATTTIRSKGGLQAVVGDVVLYRSEGSVLAGTDHSEFYSVRLGWMCAAGYGLLPLTFLGHPVGH